MLEEKLRKRQAELSRLEYLESKDNAEKTPVFQRPEGLWFNCIDNLFCLHKNISVNIFCNMLYVILS